MSNVRAQVVLRGLSVLTVLLLGASAVAAPKCNGSAEHSRSYLGATRVVRNLPEVQSWSRSHGLPVAYGASVEKQVLIDRHCYWSVTIYADRPERLELWHVFYVATASKRVLIEDPVLGEPVTLQAWRKSKGGP